MPRFLWMKAASAAVSVCSPGFATERKAVTVSGSGISGRRLSFGSDFKSSVSFSRMRPGTSQSTCAGSMRLSRYSGRCKVTPSSGWPGSKRYLSLHATPSTSIVSGNSAWSAPSASPRMSSRSRNRILGFACSASARHFSNAAPLWRSAGMRASKMRKMRSSSSHTPDLRALCSISSISWISARLWANHGARVSYSPATSAPRMNSSRDSTGSIGP